MIGNSHAVLSGDTEEVCPKDGTVMQLSTDPGYGSAIVFECPNCGYVHGKSKAYYIPSDQDLSLQ